MVVAPTSGNVVVFGTEKGAQAAFHIYENKAKWRKQKTVSSLCGHTSNVKLLAMAIDNKDKVLVSCEKCKNIKVLDLESGGHLVAYNAQNYFPTILCSNDVGDIFVKHRPLVGPNNLLLLNRNGSTFTLSRNSRKIESFIEFEERMVYLPLPSKYVAISSHLLNCYVRAFYCDIGKVKWTFSGPKDSSELAHCGIVYSPNHWWVVAVKLLFLIQTMANNCKLLH